MILLYVASKITKQMDKPNQQKETHRYTDPWLPEEKVCWGMGERAYLYGGGW